MSAPPRACRRHALLPLARIPVGQQSATRAQSLLYLGAEPRPLDALVTLSAWACSNVPSLPRVCTLINHPHPPINNPCLSPAHHSSFPLQPKQSLPRYSTNYAKPTLPGSCFVMKLDLHAQPTCPALHRPVSTQTFHPPKRRGAQDCRHLPLLVRDRRPGTFAHHPNSRREMVGKDAWPIAQVA
jgi:hypothetical protein